MIAASNQLEAQIKASMILADLEEINLSKKNLKILEHGRPNKGFFLNF